MSDTKKFVDQLGLKQVITLLKGLIQSNYETLDAKISSQGSGGTEALTAAKQELNAAITTNATAIATNAASIAANKTATDAAIASTAQTAADNLAAAKQELSTSIANVAQNLADTKIKFVIVEALPSAAEADERTIYLIKNTEAGRAEDNQNIYIEYMFINGKYEELGDTQISLADYSTAEQVNAKVEDALTVCENTYVAEVELKEKVETIVDTVTTTEIINKNIATLTSVEISAMFTEKPAMVKANGTVVSVDTIEEAIVNAEEGDTIVLGKDVELTAGTQIADGVTIDLNGFTMTVGGVA